MTGLALSITVNPLITIIGLGGFIFGLALIFMPGLWLPGVLIFSVIGELVRLPIGPLNGLLLNDLFIPFIIGLWLIKKLAVDQNFPTSQILKPLFIFIAIATLSLVYNYRFLGSSSEIITSSLYLIRFTSYALLLPLAIDQFQTKTKKLKLTKAVIIAAVALSLIGFIQLLLVSDFTDMAEAYGWDPHIGRLLSSWFDPNFIGGFLALIICLSLGWLLYEKSTKSKTYLSLAIVIMLTALFLTYSRSAYLALAVGLFIIGLLKSRALIITGLIMGLLLISVSDRARDRVTDMYYSGLSVIGLAEAENPDPTARLRVESWQQNLELAKANLFTGIGYNTLRFRKLKAGFAKDVLDHSAAGSDSSLLTILVTTGLFGLIFFMWIFLKILQINFSNWRDKNLPAWHRGLSLGFLAGLFSLFFIHSLFVNSLLYFPILIYVWILTGALAKPSFEK